MDNVAAALEALYTVAPEDFVAARKQLVDRAKQAGDKAAAKLIAAQKRPTQIAYLFNQLARSESEGVQALADVGRELARAQRAALRTGDSKALREAMAAQRETLSDMLRKTSKLADKLQVQVPTHAITAVLRAAMADPAVSEALEAGQLQSAPEAEGGFGGGRDLAEALAASAVGAEKREKSEGKKAEEKKAEEKAEEKKAEEKKAEEARAKAEAEKKAKEEKEREAKEKAARAEAEREAKAMAREAEQAAHAAERAEAKAVELEARAAEARAEADRAHAEAAKLTARAEKAMRALA